MQDHANTYIILSTIFGFIMAWGIGANDVANAMGTSVGSKALKLWQAIIIAAVFEFLGAMLAGGQVTETLRSNIIDTSLLYNQPEVLIHGMLAALLAAGTWLAVATYFGWPVSTTHSIVGAIIGFGIISLGINAVHWQVVEGIAISWILTPCIAAVIAYLIFMSIQKFILDHASPSHRARQLSPIYIFFVAFIIASVTLFKGLKPIGLKPSLDFGLSLAFLVALLIMLLGYLILSLLKTNPNHSLREQHASVEKIFASLMIFTASAMAFAHGSNDVANAIGPVAAVIAIVHGGTQQLINDTRVPIWVLGLGGVGIVAGLASYGYRVIATIGNKITSLTPSRGFSAELATATTIIVASGLGLPVSTTQTLVGAILGVGFARGIGAINLRTLRNIFSSWVITLPAGALLAVTFYYLLHHLF